MDRVKRRTGARSERGPGRPRGASSTCRERLLDAALTAFAAQGYEGVRLRAIAAAADCDVSMVAHHFGSKAALWLAVIDRLADRLGDDAVAAGAPQREAEGIEARVLKAAGRLFDQVAGDPHLLRFLIREQIETGERFEHLVRRVFEPVYETYRPLWQEAIDGGLFRLSHPWMVHALLLGALSFLVASLPAFARLEGVSMELGQIREEFLRGLLPVAPEQGAGGGGR